MIGKQYIEIIPKKYDEEKSFIWRKSNIAGVKYYSPKRFNTVEFIESYLWRADTIKKLIFFSIATWGELSQDRVLRSLGLNAAVPSILASISSNLEAGRKHELYTKTGRKKSSSFSLASNFENSKQLVAIRFVPSKEAINIAQKRAKRYANQKPNN